MSKIDWIGTAKEIRNSKSTYKEFSNEKLNLFIERTQKALDNPSNYNASELAAAESFKRDVETILNNRINVEFSDVPDLLTPSNWTNSDGTKVSTSSFILRAIGIIILIIFGIVTGLIIVYIVMMLITLPFAIDNEYITGTFKFKRFAKNVVFGPVFAARYSYRYLLFLISANNNAVDFRNEELKKIRKKGEFA